MNSIFTKVVYAQVLEDRTPPPLDIKLRAYPDYLHKFSFYNIFVI